MPNVAEAILGGFNIGVLVSCMLYGISIMQTFIYYRKYPEDSKFVKLLVFAIFVLETVHVGSSIDTIYAYMTRHFGDEEFAVHIYWGIGVTVVVEATVATLVEAFLVRRVWIMGKRETTATVIIFGTFAFCRFVLGITTIVLSYSLPGRTWVAFVHDTKVMITIGVGMGVGVIADLGTAANLCYYLARGRSDLPRETQGTINLIMIYAINSGALTGFTSLVSFVLALTQKNNVTFLGILAIQSRLYSNSFLGSLNARDFIRSAGQSSRYHSSSSRETPGGRLSTAKFNVHTSTVISTSTTHEGSGATLPLGANRSVQEYPLQDVKGPEIA